LDLLFSKRFSWLDPFSMFSTRACMGLNFIKHPIAQACHLAACHRIGRFHTSPKTG
jgi:hypothetical protein